MRLRFILTLAIIFVGSVALGRAQGDTYPEEASRLAVQLHWQEGSVVADVGAGEGELTLAAAKRVGPTGHVYTTEIDAKKLAHLQELAAKNPNITAIQAGADRTNLPLACCDSIFLRLVYHHLAKPAEIDASLLQALKPGGLLAVIDREPPAGTTRVEGVPENRVGHGMPEKILIQELTAEGFELVKSIDDWPGGDATRHPYCVVVRKPGP